MNPIRLKLKKRKLLDSLAMRFGQTIITKQIIDSVDDLEHRYIDTLSLFNKILSLIEIKEVDSLFPTIENHLVQNGRDKYWETKIYYKSVINHTPFYPVKYINFRDKMMNIIIYPDVRCGLMKITLEIIIDINQTNSYTIKWSVLDSDNALTKEKKEFEGYIKLDDKFRLVESSQSILYAPRLTVRKDGMLGSISFIGIQPQKEISTFTQSMYRFFDWTGGNFYSDSDRLIVEPYFDFPFFVELDKTTFETFFTKYLEFGGLIITPDLFNEAKDIVEAVYDVSIHWNDDCPILQVRILPRDKIYGFSEPIEILHTACDYFMANIMILAGESDIPELSAYIPKVAEQSGNPDFEIQLRHLRLSDNWGFTPTPEVTIN